VGVINDFIYIINIINYPNIKAFVIDCTFVTPDPFKANEAVPNNEPVNDPVNEPVALNVVPSNVNVGTPLKVLPLLYCI
jgi:hypothetical protein